MPSFNITASLALLPLSATAAPAPPPATAQGACLNETCYYSAPVWVLTNSSSSADQLYTATWPSVSRCPSALCNDSTGANSTVAVDGTAVVDSMAVLQAASVAVTVLEAASFDASSIVMRMTGGEPDNPAYNITGE